ncbi:MAG: pyridoxamine 5'-phosphate oxidase family protein [Bacteroidia bacterium]|nr:MAG: pyridoxamine 5'-phosphate oxidase family protein [Bacteroidia bacterium]
MRRKEREITDPGVIDKVIGRTNVCHVALADGDMPYIVAMNFGYKRGNPSVLYFHCAPAGRKLDIIERNSNACFQLDTGHNLVEGEKACDFTMKYSSVLGFGTIAVVTSTEEREAGLNIIMQQYTGRDDYSFNPSTMSRTTILKLVISEISCKIVE